MTDIPLLQQQTGEPTGRFFTARRILCIGQNYPAHTSEMGGDPDKQPPFYFMKPLSALNVSGQLSLPSYSNDVHHELELVLGLVSGGSNFSEAEAAACIGGVALGLDMTCRDVQKQAKAAGRPWEQAKGFDGAAPCSDIMALTAKDLHTVGEMSLHCNGHLVQRGHWKHMLWSPIELLQHISRYIALQQGDLVFTGTPAGVARVKEGDSLCASADGLPMRLQVTVV